VQLQRCMPRASASKRSSSPKNGADKVMSRRMCKIGSALSISLEPISQKISKSTSKNIRGDFLDIRAGKRAGALKTFDDHVEVLIGDEAVSAKLLLVASGANRRKLEVPGAKEYDQKGLTYCASCDGPLFADQDVAVVGGGNAGFETALQLLAYCKSVTLLHRGSEFKADEITVAAAKAMPNFKGVLNVQPLEIQGEQFVTGVKYKDGNGQEVLLPVTGIFVEIGLVPNTEWVGDALKKNSIGQIVTDPSTQRTSEPRVWAAGDCTDGHYHQNNIAAGDAVRALEDMYMFLRGAKDRT
jgi:alkyl hydroperoxide reductase subunit F